MKQSPGICIRTVINPSSHFSRPKWNNWLTYMPVYLHLIYALIGVKMIFGGVALEQCLMESCGIFFSWMLSKSSLLLVSPTLPTLAFKGALFVENKGSDGNHTLDETIILLSDAVDTLRPGCEPAPHCSTLSPPPFFSCPHPPSIIFFVLFST